RGLVGVPAGDRRDLGAGQGRHGGEQPGEGDARASQDPDAHGNQQGLLPWGPSRSVLSPRVGRPRRAGASPDLIGAVRTGYQTEGCPLGQHGLSVGGAPGGSTVRCVPKGVTWPTSRVLRRTGRRSPWPTRRSCPWRISTPGSTHGPARTVSRWTGSRSRTFPAGISS